MPTAVSGGCTWSTDGAKASHPVNLAVLERIALRVTPLEVDSTAAASRAKRRSKRSFSSGAKRAICGSIAATQPDIFPRWSRRLRPAADGPRRRHARRADLDQRLAADRHHGRRRADRSTSVLSGFPSHLHRHHAGRMLSGPSTSLYTKLQAVFPEIDITVSGGIGSWSDIEELDRLGLRSVIVGKAIYEGRISFDQLRVTAR